MNFFYLLCTYNAFERTNVHSRAKQTQRNILQPALTEHQKHFFVNFAKVKKPTDAVVLKNHRTWPSSRRLPCGRTLGPPRKAWTWETCVRGLLRFPPYFPPLKAVDAGNAVSPNQEQARQGGHQLFAAPNHSHVCLLAG